MSTHARDENLRRLIEEALIQISVGMCHFKAKSKHEQLKDAHHTLKQAQAILLTPSTKGANDNGR